MKGVALKLSLCIPSFGGASASTDRIGFSELADFAVLAENLGYSNLWAPDHFILGGESGEHEVWTLLSALASRTESIGIGTLVLSNTHRNPALMAKMAATLDYLSGGRLRLGIGAGWFQREQVSYGLPWVDDLKERMDRLAEGVEVMKAVFSGSKSTFRGRFYRFSDLICQPRPIQVPWPQLWIGGGGEKRTLRLVAQHADAWNIPAVTPDVYAQKMSVLNAHCADLKRNPHEIERTMETRALISEAGDEMWEHIADWFMRWQRGSDGSTSLSRQDVISRLREIYLIGSVSEVAEKIARYKAVGVEHLTVYVLDYPKTETLEQLSRMVTSL